MPTPSKAASGGHAHIDFHCLNPDCGAVVKFDLADVKKRGFQAVCPECLATYKLDDALRDRLMRMLSLVEAIRNAEDLLGDANVAIATRNEEIRIPYAMLLTRLNTIITLEFGGHKVDFHLWIEPSSPETFR